MVKTGYKQTEIGVIPEDWEVSSFGEIISKTIGGGTPSRNIKEYWNGNIPWMSVKDFTSFNPKCTQEYISELGVKNSATRIVPKGNLIIATRIALGKIVKYEVDVTINQDLKTIDLNRNIDQNYFIYSYRFLENKIIEKGSGSTVLGLSINDLKSFQIPLPPLPEQQAIAEALSDADAWIESLEQLIAKKRLLKQGAMQELLTPKEDWEVRKIGDIFDITAGGDLVKYEVNDLKTNDFIYNVYSNSLSNKGLYCYANEYSHLENTITVSARGTVGYAVPRFEKYVAIGRLLSLSPKFELDIRFASEFLNNKIRFANESTGVPQLTAPQISTYDLPLPSFEEQTRIATILSDMDLELAALEQQLEKARQIKQGMMQELLTGRIRLI